MSKTNVIKHKFSHVIYKSIASYGEQMDAFISDEKASSWGISNVDKDKQSCPFQWQSDCLSIAVLLAHSLSLRDIRKYGKQRAFSLCQSGAEKDKIAVFQRLHEECHSKDGQFSKIIAKKLNERFSGMLSRVRSLDIDGIKQLYIQSSYLLPVFWAVLTDERADIRSYGRYMAHDIVWKAMRQTSQKDENETALERIKELEQTIVSLKDRNNTIEQQLRQKDKERQNLVVVCNGLEAQIKELYQLKAERARLMRENNKLSYQLEKSQTKPYESIKELDSFNMDTEPLYDKQEAHLYLYDKEELCSEQGADNKRCPLEG
ncbi:hypothetical protein MCHI_002012, partial [Candidatus Magnetoovum chiemensis]